MTSHSIRSIDIPQITRFGVGFDTMFDRLEEIIRANAHQSQTNYPPYNVIRYSEDEYTIEIAVAGFNEGDISIEVGNDQLKVTGKQVEVVNTDKPIEYVHRGISSRSFERVWTLAEHVEVIGARQENGILIIDLERKIPEEKKPKNIAITYTK